jgi:hypothetical protein
MTSDDFRKIALSMPGAVEAGHMDHPDFRIAGKIFATLGYPNHEFGMLKVPPEEQIVLVAAHPSVFGPAAGAWGRNGSTLVRLDVARDAVVRRAMELACDATRAKPAKKRKAERDG